MSAVSSMLSVAPWSKWQMTRSGLVTSMSPVVAIWPAVTSPGPVADSCSRLGPSPSIFSDSCLMLRMMSVTSSRTPASDENSCSTPSILIEVTAAPCSELSSTRRSELPSVMPNPRSSGSATNEALRRTSVPGLRSSALGFLSSCQFFALTAIFLPWQCGVTASRQTPDFELLLSNLGRSPTPAGRSDAAALGRADAVVRDRRDVADRGDLEADRLEGTQRALAAGARALDLDLEGADAMLGGLAPGIL